MALAGFSKAVERVEKCSFIFWKESFFLSRENACLRLLLLQSFFCCWNKFLVGLSGAERGYVYVFGTVVETY